MRRLTSKVSSFTTRLFGPSCSGRVVTTDFEGVFFYHQAFRAFVQRPGGEGESLVFGGAFAQTQVFDDHGVDLVGLQILVGLQQHVVGFAGHGFRGDGDHGAALRITFVDGDRVLGFTQVDGAGEAQHHRCGGGDFALAVIGIGVQQRLRAGFARVGSAVVDG